MLGLCCYIFHMELMENFSREVERSTRLQTTKESTRCSLKVTSMPAPRHVWEDRTWNYKMLMTNVRMYIWELRRELKPLRSLSACTWLMTHNLQMLLPRIPRATHCPPPPTAGMQGASKTPRTVVQRGTVSPTHSPFWMQALHHNMTSTQNRSMVS